MIVGELSVTCPDCGVRIPVPVEASVETTQGGSQVLLADFDEADVWAHAWLHDPELSGG